MAILIGGAAMAAGLVSLSMFLGERNRAHALVTSAKRHGLSFSPMDHFECASPPFDLFREGDAGDAVYLIVRGKVRVFVGGGERPEQVLNELGPGACIGEMAVLDREPRSATVRALERTRALRVPGDGFKRVMGERPEMSEAIVAELVRRMRGLMAQATDRR